MNKTKDNSDSKKSGLTLENIFGIDLRTLALFRIAVSIIIIIDLIMRTEDIEAFYTDSGIVPRFLVMQELRNNLQFSFHFINGTLEFQIFMFILAGIFAFALLMGYKTRLATFMSWLLLTSLHIRSPLFLDGGDFMLRLLLFWSMFLPLGAYYSVDSALNNSPDQKPVRLLSVATLAILLQVAFMYWFTGLVKVNNSEWINGQAVYYALSESQYATDFGAHIVQLPFQYLKILTYFVLGLELYGTFLLFSPFIFLRLTAIFLFFCMHLGFLLSMKIGLFPYVDFVALLLFFPSGIWEKALPKLKTEERLGLKIYYDGECGFCKKMILILHTLFLIPETKFTAAQTDVKVNAEMESVNSWIVIDYKGNKYFKFDAFKVICKASPILKFILPILKLKLINNIGEKIYDKVATNRNKASKLTSFLTYAPVSIKPSSLNNILVAFFLVYIFFSNLGNVYPNYKIPEKYNWVGNFLYIHQWWNMFAPLEKEGTWYNLWYVIPARLKDGTEVDLFKGGEPVTWERPKLVSDYYQNRFWQKFMILMGLGQGKYLPYFGKYLCHKWNSNSENKKAEIIDIYVMYEKLFPEHKTEETKKYYAWREYCASGKT